MRFVQAERFEDWRETARSLLAAEVSPAEVHWSARGNELLFGSEEELLPMKATTIRVPPEFVALAKDVAFHRDANRWELLYRLLWRLTHGERQLLEVLTDDDVRTAEQMQKAVKRDEHKMHAFVRFRRVVDGDGQERFIAWHRPDHLIVRMAAPFFARRFSGMQWSILTPDESAHWDGNALTYSPGVPASLAPKQDALDELWRTYYANIFNPARVNVAQMKKEMPVRHWATLPEAQLIPELLAQAESRVRTMIDEREGFSTSAAAFIPAQYDLRSLAAAAKSCTACDLHCHATQTVFGRGPANARLVLLGEQPGDQEDLEGLPFVGPAGQLLADVCAQVGLDRQQVYQTNVVKHFKFVLRGKRRLHQKPGSREISACQPWLAAELNLIKPITLVCLGSTAAQAIFGRGFRLSEDRGKFSATQFAKQTIATWHPAAILRMTNDARQQEMREQLVRDLTISAAMLA